jgi:hypothetical protein
MIGVRTTAALHAANVSRPTLLAETENARSVAPPQPGGHSCPGGPCDVDRVHVLCNQERPSAHIMHVHASSLFGLDHSNLTSSWRQSERGTRLSLFRLGVWARFHTELPVRIFRSMPDTTGRARFGGLRGSHPRTKREADLGRTSPFRSGAGSEMHVGSSCRVGAFADNAAARGTSRTAAYGPTATRACY